MKKILAILLFLPVFTKAQIITTIAGNGTRGYSGDGGPATIVQLDQPCSIAIDNSGSLYIVNAGTENIRKISSDGIITNVAGIQHECGYNGDNIPATAAQICKPHGIVTDHSGNVYFSEYENNTIRKISADGIMHLIAGGTLKFGFCCIGTFIEARNALLYHPNDITMDKYGNIYFADEGNNMIRKISTDGKITTVAGIGYEGYAGDGGMATAAELNNPWGVAIDDNGNIFFSDTHNNVVRKVNTAGIISTIAGNHIAGYTGDGGRATAARLNKPQAIAIDKSGNLYITDKKDDVIRRVSADGIITTFAGTGTNGYSGDGGMATNARLNMPSDIAIDNEGNVYIADDQNHVIRKVSASTNEIKEIPKKEISISDAFNLSADPEKNSLTIKIDPGAYTSFTITDNTDKVLIQQSIKNSLTDIDISILPPGRYYINLKKDSKVKTAIFVKDK